MSQNLGGLFEVTSTTGLAVISFNQLISGADSRSYLLDCWDRLTSYDGDGRVAKILIVGGLHRDEDGCVSTARVDRLMWKYQQNHVKNIKKIRGRRVIVRSMNFDEQKNIFEDHDEALMSTREECLARAILDYNPSIVILSFCFSTKSKLPIELKRAKFVPTLFDLTLFPPTNPVLVTTNGAMDMTHWRKYLLRHWDALGIGQIHKSILVLSGIHGCRDGRIGPRERGFVRDCLQQKRIIWENRNKIVTIDVLDIGQFCQNGIDVEVDVRSLRRVIEESNPSMIVLAFCYTRRSEIIKVLSKCGVVKRKANDCDPDPVN